MVIILKLFSDCHKLRVLAGAFDVIFIMYEPYAGKLYIIVKLKG